MKFSAPGIQIIFFRTIILPFSKHMAKITERVGLLKIQLINTTVCHNKLVFISCNPVLQIHVLSHSNADENKTQKSV